MIRIVFFLCSVLIIVGCEGDNDVQVNLENEDAFFISAVDISSYPEISTYDLTFKDNEGSQKDFLTLIKESGVNTIRLRLWVDPSSVHSSLDEVKNFSQTLKSQGFKIWLSLHYSDTWADPGQQQIPSAWLGSSFSTLVDEVYTYTQNIVQEVNPDFIQIGNEINTGLLHPEGNIVTNLSQFKTLIQSGISAVRDNSEDAQIILHFAGFENADWFFEQVDTLDYDIIGLSYYPIWHTKSLSGLQTSMQALSEKFKKNIVIAETAYPFTLAWNDWTNNIVGLEEQLILPTYPATPDGQSQFVREIFSLTKDVVGGVGVCYWGGELVAWKGVEGVEASPWENQALFDFQNQVLPALREFNID